MAAANLYEPPPPSYQAAQGANNHFAGKTLSKTTTNHRDDQLICLDTTMYVSPAQAPYEGVYQRQPTGLPKAEFIPQYPAMPSAPPEPSSSNPYMNPPMQYPPQSAYQNSYGGQMYVPQMNPYQPVCLNDIQ